MKNRYFITPTSFYNLTMDYKDGEWIQNVVEFKPTLENFDNLMGGLTNDINGDMSILFTSNENGLNTETNCYAVGIISNNCGTPAISETCITKKYATFCFDNENNVLLGEESNIFNNTDSTDFDYSFILNTNDLKKNLSIFAENHVLINNQIITLLQDERNINFDNFPFTGENSPQNLEEFKTALSMSGVDKAEELANLILSQTQNRDDFLAENKDFALLKEETKQILIDGEIDSALIENPINWPAINPGNTTQSRTCAQQYAIDKARCTRTTNRNGIGALVACWGGPVLCMVACLIVLAETNDCLNNALDDYNDCLN